MMLVFHIDVNCAYLSWTAAALLEDGYETDLREVPSAIAGDLNITVRRSRQSGVARATCPD